MHIFADIPRPEEVGENVGWVIDVDYDAVTDFDADPAQTPEEIAALAEDRAVGFALGALAAGASYATSWTKAVTEDPMHLHIDLYRTLASTQGIFPAGDEDR